MDGLYQMTRGLEIEGDGIADIQGQYFVSLNGDFVSYASEITYSVANIIQAGSGGNFADLGCGHLATHVKVSYRRATCKSSAISAYSSV